MVDSLVGYSINHFGTEGLHSVHERLPQGASLLL